MTVALASLRGPKRCAKRLLCREFASLRRLDPERSFVTENAVAFGLDRIFARSFGCRIAAMAYCVVEPSSRLRCQFPEYVSFGMGFAIWTPTGSFRAVV